MLFSFIYWFRVPGSGLNAFKRKLWTWSRCGPANNRY